MKYTARSMTLTLTDAAGLGASFPVSLFEYEPEAAIGVDHGNGPDAPVFTAGVWAAGSFTVTMTGPSIVGWLWLAAGYGRRRNPPPWFLRIWTRHRFGWSGRTFRRVPLSQVRRLWRARL